MLIGLTGYKGVGKDTAADFLCERDEYVKIAFADRLKDAVANLFNITRDQVEMLKNDLTWVTVHWPMADEAVREMSFREFLQRFGTEMGRNTFGRDFWVTMWEHSYWEANTDTGRHVPVVVTDVRFENEAQKIRELDGKVIRILRPGYVSDGHASETDIPSYLIDAVVMNEGTMDEFRENFFAVMEEIWN